MNQIKAYEHQTGLDLIDEMRLATCHLRLLFKTSIYEVSGPEFWRMVDKATTDAVQIPTASLIAVIGSSPLSIAASIGIMLAGRHLFIVPAQSAQALLPFAEWMFVCDKDIRAQQLRNIPSPTVLLEAKEPQVWLCSSGSRGMQKIVIHKQSSILKNADMNRKVLPFELATCNAQILSVAYSYGFVAQVLGALLSGIPSVFLPIVAGDDEALASEARASGVDMTFMTPPAFRALVRGCEQARPSRPWLRFLAVGGGPLDIPYQVRGAEILDHTRIALTYGLAEAGPRVCTRFLNGSDHAYALGKPLPGVALGAEQSSDSTSSRLLVSSPSLFIGYATKSNGDAYIDDRNNLVTDDHVLMDDDSILILGKGEESLAGANGRIYRRHIEDVIYSHSNIIDAMISFYCEGTGEKTVHILLDALDQTNSITKYYLSERLGIPMEAIKLTRGTGFRKWKGFAEARAAY